MRLRPTLFHLPFLAALLALPGRAHAGVGGIQVEQRGSLAVDADSDGKADAGDLIQYNTSAFGTGTGATGVSLTVDLDSHTALSGTVHVSPLALDDAYSTLGNVSLTVAAPGVLANDRSFLSDTFSISAYDASSAHGGSVSLAADGSFGYRPPAGFTGTDSFNYTLQGPTGLQGSGKVSLSVSHRVWFVDNSAAGGGDGTLNAPFNTLAAAAVAADQAGDCLYIARGDGTGTGLGTALTLLNGQQVVGSDADLSVASTLLIPARHDGGPLLQPSASAGIVLASNCTVTGLTLQNAGGIGISANGVSNVALVGLSISSSSGAGLSLLATGGYVYVTGVSLLGNGSGLVMSGGGGAYAIGLNSITGGSTGPLASVSGVTGTGSIDLGQVSSASCQQGVVLANDPGINFQMDGLAVQCDLGAGAGAYGLKADTTGSVTILGSPSVQVSTGETALYLKNVTLSSGPFSQIDATGASAAGGVFLSAVSGALSASAGSISGRSGGVGFDVEGGGSSVYYGGSIASGGAGSSAVKVGLRTNGAVVFGGAVSALGGGGVLVSASRAPALQSFLGLVSLSNTSGAAVSIIDSNVSFADLEIANLSGGQPGLVDSGGGQLGITTGSIATVGSGQPLRLDGITADVQLVAVSANGAAAPAIQLNEVDGDLSVVGDSGGVSDNSGGTVQALGAGQAGVLVTDSDADLSLCYMHILGLSGAPAIYIDETNTAGEAQRLFQVDVEFNRVEGSSIDGSTADGLVFFAGDFDSAGLFIFDNVISGVQGHGLLVHLEGQAAFTDLDIEDNSISNAAYGGIDVALGGSSQSREASIRYNEVGGGSAWSQGDGMALATLASSSGAVLTARLEDNELGNNGDGAGDFGLQANALGNGSTLDINSESNQFFDNYDAGIGAESLATLSLSGSFDTYFGNGAHLANEGLRAEADPGSLCLKTSDTLIIGGPQAFDLSDLGGFFGIDSLDVSATKSGGFGPCSAVVVP